VGRFGYAYTENPLWTVDPDNPSVHSSTVCGSLLKGHLTHSDDILQGVPLCIPRNSTDAECPLTNRPKDGNGFYLTAL
jgi:hypothetical protein